MRMLPIPAARCACRLARRRHLRRWLRARPLRRCRAVLSPAPVARRQARPQFSGSSSEPRSSAATSRGGTAWRCCGRAGLCCSPRPCRWSLGSRRPLGRCTVGRSRRATAQLSLRTRRSGDVPARSRSGTRHAGDTVRFAADTISSPLGRKQTPFCQRRSTPVARGQQRLAITGNPVTMFFRLLKS